jgi:multidrug efflux pump subunit AcrA (membrane-fusion protein)
MSRNHRVRPFILGSVLIVGTSIAAGCGAASTTTQAAPESAAAAAPVIDVPVVKATVGAIESALEISGTLTPRTRVAVKPKLPGTLEQVLVDIGDAVRDGQTIATLDRREIDAQVDASVAAVGVAKAALDPADAGLANAVLEQHGPSRGHRAA